MPTTASPILGGMYQSRALLLNNQRLVNGYVELVETKDGKMPGAIIGTPGLLFKGVSDAPAEWRGGQGLHVIGNGSMFGVVGDSFVQVTNNFTLIKFGTLSTVRGPVGMVDNGTQLLIVDGVHAYGYDTASNTFAVVSLPFLAGAPIVCAYQDGFFLINQTGTQQWWQSALNDCFTWNALDFSSKDGQPDPIVALVDNHREMWLFGSKTTEVWINAGQAGFAFARLQGVFIQEGCAAPYSAIVCQSSILWLAQSKEGTGMVMKSVGYQSQRISTHAIEREIQGFARINDATAYCYQQEGHLFYVLTFPSADRTFCFDLTTGLWHERAAFSNGSFHRHRSNCYALFRGMNIVGDFENGRLYDLDLGTYDDDGDMKKFLRTWPAQSTGQLTHRRDTHSQLELYTQPGGHLDCGPNIRVLKSSDDDWRTLHSSDNDVRVLSGAEVGECAKPQYMLRWSDDGGQSFGNEHWISAGEIGETILRYIWRRLGSSRDRIYELSATDRFAIRIVGAWLTTEPGTS